MAYLHDVWRRVMEHNQDKGAQAMRGNGPWFPFSIVCLASQKDAKELERELQNNFTAVGRRAETSLREVLAQVGVALLAEHLHQEPLRR